MTADKQAIVDKLLNIIEETNALEDSSPSEDLPEHSVGGMETLASEAKSIAVGIGKNLALAQYAHGLTARVLKRFKEASSALIKAYALNPKSYEILVELVVSLDVQGRNDQALRYARELHALEPESAGTICTLAMCLHKCSHKKEASLLIEQALDKEPNSGFVRELHKLITTPLK